MYSKWFFLTLAAVCVVDLIAEWAQSFLGVDWTHAMAIPLDAVAAVLALWMFTDLHRRRPRRKDGDHTPG